MELNKSRQKAEARRQKGKTKETSALRHRKNPKPKS
jgi:hypothetical protein